MGLLALRTHHLAFKLAEPACCGLLLFVFRHFFGLRNANWILLAFLGSMIGDYFLSTRSGHEHYFVYGIAAFFVAHLGYLGFALKNGRLHGLALLALLVCYVPFFVFQLNPAMNNTALRIASFLYLLVSCVSMAAATGLRMPRASKSFYILGIGLVLFSDTIIAWNEFLHYRQWNWLILPTYYLAHICVTLALILNQNEQRKPDAALSPDR